MTSNKVKNTENISQYKQAGVDIDAGNQLVSDIKPFVKSTNRAGVMGAIGGFGGLFDLKACGYNDPILVSGTDGVGTKLKLAQQFNMHDTIGIDLVAMCVNDIIVQGAEPLFFLDYFACGKLEVDVAARVVKSIADGCKQAGCALIGGETAEMPGMYSAGEYDLAGFTVGAVERQKMLPIQEGNNAIAVGDELLAMASSGVHSNGYSLVRKIINDNNLDLTQKISDIYDADKGSDEFSRIKDKTLAQVVLEPTRIYVKQCLELLGQHNIKAFAHITGGGLTENIPRVFTDNIGCEIDLGQVKLPFVFRYLNKYAQMQQDDMLKTFNCGVGMVIVADATTASNISAQNPDIIRIGKIIEGSGVSYINSL